MRESRSEVVSPFDIPFAIRIDHSTTTEGLSVPCFTRPSDNCLIDGLGLLVNWVGAAGTGVTTLKQAAIKAAIKHAAKQKQDPNKKDQDSRYDDATKNDKGYAEQMSRTPTDGVEKWVWSVAVVKGVYNPKNYYADPKTGYYGQTIDDQEIYIIFETVEELEGQLRHIQQ